MIASSAGIVGEFVAHEVKLHFKGLKSFSAISDGGLKRERMSDFRRKADNPQRPMSADVFRAPVTFNEYIRSSIFRPQGIIGKSPSVFCIAAEKPIMRGAEI
jgi:hypothetical protein